MVTYPFHPLFVTTARPAELSGLERQKAVALLRALLTEAARKSTTKKPSKGKKVAGNE